MKLITIMLLSLSSQIFPSIVLCKPNPDSPVKRSPDEDEEPAQVRSQDEDQELRVSGRKGPGATVNPEDTSHSMCKGDECIDYNESPKTRLDMRKMCRRKVGSTGNLSVTENADEQCKGLKCTLHTESGAIRTVTETHEMPDGSFPCGEGGGIPGVCRGGKCIMNKVAAEVLLDLTKVCRRKTLNQAATVLTETPEALLCKTLKCSVPVTGRSAKGNGTVYTFKTYVFPENASPCAGENGGMCVEGECVGVSPSRYDMRLICTKNYPGSKLVQKQASDECLKIRCTLTKGEATMQYSLAWPPVDGAFPCGPGENHVCREGVCVPKPGAK